MIEHFCPNFSFPRDSLQSLNFPTGHSLLIEHGQTNDSSHELKTGNLLSKGGTPLRPIKIFCLEIFFETDLYERADSPLSNDTKLFNFRY